MFDESIEVNRMPGYPWLYFVNFIDKQIQAICPDYDLASHRIHLFAMSGETSKQHIRQAFNGNLICEFLTENY